MNIIISLLSQWAANPHCWSVVAHIITTGVVDADTARRILAANKAFADWFCTNGGSIPREPLVKPPELLIQTSLYDALNDARAKNLTNTQLAEHVARYIAGYLACNAHVDSVLKMVAAVGGPGNLSECEAMVQAVVEKQRELD